MSTIFFMSMLKCIDIINKMILCDSLICLHVWLLGCCVVFGFAKIQMKQFAWLFLFFKFFSDMRKTMRIVDLKWMMCAFRIERKTILLPWHLLWCCRHCCGAVDKHNLHTICNILRDGRCGHVVCTKMCCHKRNIIQWNRWIWRN